MSHIEIFKFDENGDSESYGEVSNAWLGSMRVWNILGEKYCGHGASLFDMGQMEAIWNLVDDKSVTYDEKIVLFTTFDKYLVKKEDIPFLAQSAYDDACRPGNPKETSVEDITKLYESLL